MSTNHRQSETNDDRSAPVVWKVAPGGKAFLWEVCRDTGCTTINWMNHVDFRKYKTKADLLAGLQEWENKKQQGGSCKTIWQFTHEIQPGHLIVANEGRTAVRGIGIVTSKYLSPTDQRNPRKGQERHCHAHLVDWIIKERVESEDDLFGNRVTPTVLLLSHEQSNRICELYMEQHPELCDTIEDLFGLSKPKSGAGKDIYETQSGRGILTTTKARLVDARIGQGQFREDVLNLWSGRCAVTGCTTREAIRASHIKPWCKSTNEERLDRDNGIPLIATLDALFDEGLISFDDTGRMLVSNKLSDDERRRLDVSEDVRIELKSEKMKKHLQWHRQSFGFEE